MAEGGCPPPCKLPDMKLAYPVNPTMIDDVPEASPKKRRKPRTKRAGGLATGGADTPSVSKTGPAFLGHATTQGKTKNRVLNFIKSPKDMPAAGFRSVGHERPLNRETVRSSQGRGLKVQRPLSSDEDKMDDKRHKAKKSVTPPTATYTPTYRSIEETKLPTSSTTTITRKFRFSSESHSDSDRPTKVTDNSSTEQEYSDENVQEQPPLGSTSYAKPVPTDTVPHSYAHAVSSLVGSKKSPIAAAAACHPAALGIANPEPDKKRRHPPIVVEYLPNWVNHFAKLREKLGHPPNARAFGKGFRFFSQTGSEFRIYQKYLTEAAQIDKQISWHSYALAEELPTKVAIKGLPVHTTPDDLNEALKKKGFPVKYLKMIPPKRDRPGSLWFAQIDHLEAEELAKLYAVDELLNCTSRYGLRIEGWRPKERVPQCHKCQLFGHASAGCHRQPCCVRCAGEHIVADCPRTEQNPLKCVNCKGTHAANSKRCPCYRHEARRRGIRIHGPLPIVNAQKGIPTRKHIPPAVKLAPTVMILDAPLANPPTKRGARLPKRRRRRRGKGSSSTFSTASTTSLPEKEEAVDNEGKQIVPKPLPRQRPVILAVPLQEPLPKKRTVFPSLMHHIPNESKTAEVIRADIDIAAPAKKVSKGEGRTPHLDGIHSTSTKATSRQREDARPSYKNSTNTPLCSSGELIIKTLLGILTDLLASISTGGDVRDAARRGLCLLSRLVATTDLTDMV